jgi:anti-sigma B factor antagonist
VELVNTETRAETGLSFSLIVEPAREAVLLRATGELDLAATPKLDEHVGELVASGFGQVVIDLRRVTFIDLTGVRPLMRLAQDAEDSGWRLSLIEAGGRVQQMLTLTGALDRLPFQRSCAANPSSGSMALGSVC